MSERTLEDPVEFLEAASPLLLEDEARHNLILGIAGTLRDSPALYPERRLWVVENSEGVAAAALQTPPFNVVLARPRTEAALEALVGAVGDAIPGVVGALPEVELFADAWSRGRRARIAYRQGVYALERVEPVSGVQGGMRAVTPADRPLLREWWRAFTEEALAEGPPEPERMERALDHRLGGKGAGFVLWEDGGPVSLAGFGGSTPNGIRIGPVYTPPELRGRGYASALVAALSEELLAGGRRFCFLYTDLANPTSNRIYERIGYRRVCDSAEIRFE